jgi:hypothetical protein
MAAQLQALMKGSVTRILMTWPGEAWRPIADPGRAQPRNLFEFCFSDALRSLPVSAVCVRRNEVERAESDESGRRCGRNRADTLTFHMYSSFCQHWHSSSHLKNNRKLPCPGRDNSEISPAQRAGNVVPTESVLTGRRKLMCANIKMNCYRPSQHLHLCIRI